MGGLKDGGEDGSGGLECAIGREGGGGVGDGGEGGCGGRKGGKCGPNGGLLKVY